MGRGRARPALFAEVAAPVPAPAAGEERPPLVERTLPVEVDGKRFTVKVWVDETAAVAPAAARTRARAAARASVPRVAPAAARSRHPMQGTIVKVLVAVGDTVESGQALVVLEAMKMENHINAEKSGTVKELRVATGDTVGTGDVLVVIE